jgi:tetratricopeptide (TPR) repeat protein
MGLQYLEKGDYDNAVIWLERARRSDSTNKQIYLALAQCYHKMGEYRKTIESLKSASHLAPDDESVHLSLGSIYLETNDCRNAALEFEEVLRINPQNAEVPHLLSVCYFNIGVEEYIKDNRDGAIKSFEKAIENDTESLKAHQNLGFLLFQEKSLKEAKETVKRGLQVDPRNRDLLLLLAQIYQKEKNGERLLETLEKLHLYYPDDIDIALNLALVYRYQNRAEEAISLYEKLKDRYLKEKKIYYSFADLYECWGKWEKAREIYEELLIYMSKDIETHEKIAKTYHKEKRWEEARKKHYEILKIDSTHIESYRKIATLYEEEGKLKDAANAYEQALLIAPDDTILYKELGKLYQKFDDDEAIATYKRMVRLDETNSYPYVQLGIVYKKRGKEHLAEENFRKAVSLDSEDPLPYYRLASIVFAKDDTTQSLEWNRKAIRKGLTRISRLKLQFASFLKERGGKLGLGDLEELSEIEKGEREPQEIPRAALDLLFILEEETDLENELLGLLEEYQDDAILLEYLGLYYEREKNWDKAIETYEDVLKKNVKVKRAHLGLARAYEKKGMGEEALLAYRRVLEIDPEEDEAFAGLLRVSERLNREDELIEDFILLLKRYPKNVILMHYLSELYTKRGDAKSARKIEKKIKEINVPASGTENN